MALNLGTWAQRRLKAVKTTIKPYGATVKLDGMPSAYTTDGLVELVLQQPHDELTVKLPKAEVNEHTEARTQGIADRDAVTELVIGRMDEEPAPQPKRGKRQTTVAATTEPDANGQTATA